MLCVIAKLQEDATDQYSKSVQVLRRDQFPEIVHVLLCAKGPGFRKQKLIFQEARQARYNRRLL